MLASQTAVALGHLRLYEEMIKAQKQLLWAEKLSALGCLAGEVAQQIKEPLAVIKRAVGNLDAFALKETVPHEIDRINVLLEDLVQMARRRF